MVISGGALITGRLKRDFWKPKPLAFGSPERKKPGPLQIGLSSGRNFPRIQDTGWFGNVKRFRHSALQHWQRTSQTCA